MRRWLLAVGLATASGALAAPPAPTTLGWADWVGDWNGKLKWSSCSVEGEPTAVERMIEWSRHGPEDAHVTGVEVVEEEPEGLVGFAVLPTR